MSSSLANSYKNVPVLTSVALLATIIASLVADIADKGVAYSIKSSVRLGNPSFVVVNSSQYAPSISFSKEFRGWTTSMQYGSSIKDSMVMMINNTKNIPDAVQGKVYTPRTYNYEISCSKFDVYLLNRSSELLMPNGGCVSAVVRPTIAYDYDLTKARNQTVSDGRWSMTVPGNATGLYGVEPPLTQIPTTGIFAREIRACGITEVADVIQVRAAGISSIPTTMTTKCVLPTGGIQVLSMSTVQFVSPTAQEFRNASAFAIDEYDDLFQGMERSIMNSTSTPSNSNLTLFVEARSYDSTVDTLVCYSINYSTDDVVALSCAYIIIHGFVLKQQDINHLITGALGGPYPEPQYYSKAMTIHHLLDLDRGTLKPLSINSLRNSTAEASHYMASLGQNFFHDYDKGRLYVIYDTMDMEQGFYIRDWVFYFVATIMAVCILLVALTTCLLDSVYTNSFYGTVATRVAPHIDSSAPMLMQSQVNPLKLEGFSVLRRHISEIDQNPIHSPK
ncbi:hypothetical protein BGZ80_000499 [Entomortierella chlamydospora]|uniref:Uncharacterized protein n=1 Tax=Entomortierella chlamydospora TaxID=101097 RepID=A0A9P6MS41_9FUNG|nr:hypothetical protein BGZ79_004765 [Entomortierella chlamydospora]KAG0011695.1 hypothetical protein BGZ80_000499 [Entomortierella chlamydospora]